MTTHLPSALLLVFSVAFTLACSAEEKLPYDLSQETYKTETLFSAQSITRHGSGESETAVYKGSAYGIYMRVGDERVMVVKAPLDGSKAVTLPLIAVEDPNREKTKGYTASGDNHTVYIIAVDRAGYIHVCGGMHSSKIVYWRSDKPEDISSFTRIMPDAKLPERTQPCPIAGSITFPEFHSDRHGQLFWTALQGCGPLCSYDETKKLWTAFGNPLDAIGENKKRKSDDISFYYTDKTGHDTTDTSVVKGGLSQKKFKVAWDRNGRMHMVFGLLNRHIYIGDRGSAHSVLYAYSDDGGKTVHKSNGEPIQLPITPDAGPHQGEVITSKGNNMGRIVVDKANRPMIWFTSGTGDHYGAGDHCVRLESGRWVEVASAPRGGDLDPNGVMICKDDKQDRDGLTRYWGPDLRNSRHLDFPVTGYDPEYYRDTGELVWTSLKGDTDKATYIIHRTVFDRVSK